MIRYLLDEHVSPVYRIQLVRAEPALTVWAIGDPGAPPHGTHDPDILIWCETHDFVLVTNNRKSMPQHLADHLGQGRHIPGILIINLGLPMGQMIDELILIAGTAQAGDYQDLLLYLPIT